jgi:exopolysaccharide biosynthesis polyprenyl glycosylphosphotransferase
MIRLFHIYLPGRTLLLAGSESLLIAASLIVAIFIWFGADTELILRYDHGFGKAAVSAFVCMLCMYYYDLYDSIVMHNDREVLSRLIQVLGTACLILALLWYAVPDVRLSPAQLVTWAAITGGGLVLSRRIFSRVNRRPRLRERALLIGEGTFAAELTKEIESRPELGLELLAASRASNGLNPIDQLAGTSEPYAACNRIRRIILAAPLAEPLSLEALLGWQSRGMRIQSGSDLYEAVTGRVALQRLTPSWLIATNEVAASRLVLFYKRASSLVFALIALALATPVMFLMALLVKLDSPGPVLFHQRRVGRLGKIFVLYKFRSMYHVKDDEPLTRPAERSDKRFTRVGRWLRRTRMDELPQLFNVLRGDMCLIGPRPFSVDQEEQYAIEIPFYRLRWSVKPGATGWAQVERGYCESLEDNIEKLSYDLYYIKNISVGLDCIILFKTLKILLLGRGAR